MKRLHQLLFLCTFMILGYSCSEDLNEQTDPEQSTTLKNEALVLMTLEEIDNPALLEQLGSTELQIKQILADNYSEALRAHNPDAMYLDEEKILIGKNPDNSISYTFSVVIPDQQNNDKLQISSYLTMSFDGERNLYNSLQFGFEEPVRFNANGELLSHTAPIVNQKGGDGYTPKPSNKPSKAPKSVICNWASSTGNLGTVNGYCGFTIGIGGPAPIWVLAALFPEWYIYDPFLGWIELDFPREIIPLTSDINDLYYLYSDDNTYPLYNLNFHPNFSGLYNEIVDYYGKVYVWQLGYYITNPFSMTYDEDHVHKQAFIDSFFQWTYRMQSTAAANYSYLTSNPDVYYQIFNLFAEYNLSHPNDEPLYLEQPWYVVQYTPNQDVKCLNNGSNYLLTPAGLLLMQQLGDGTITIEAFRSALPDCN